MILPGLDRSAVSDAPSPEAMVAGGDQERLVVSSLIGEGAGLPPLDRRRLRTSLRQTFAWSREHFDLLSKLEKVPDGRNQERATIPLPAILLALLLMFWLRMGSIRALDDRLRVSPGLRRQLAQVGWSEGISENTFADALERAGVETIRDAFRAMTKRVLKRWGAGRYKDSQLAKQLAGYTPGLGRLVVRIPVAIDGHETFTCCPKRECELCLTRKVKRKVNGVEVEVEVEERYHRIVSAQWVGSHPAMILDFEPVLPKEGEQQAAYRLVERLAKEYGQAIGTLIGDALYDSEPFRRVAGKAGVSVQGVEGFSPC